MNRKQLGRFKNASLLEVHNKINQTMKKIIFLVALTILFKNVDAQKMYIWCPNQLTATPRTGQLKNVEINVLINDNRILTDNSKNKCTSEELLNSLYSLIKTTYPSSNINRIIDGKQKNLNWYF